jgi:hypothetical protein
MKTYRKRNFQFCVCILDYWFNGFGIVELKMILYFATSVWICICVCAPGKFWESQGYKYFFFTVGNFCVNF